MSKPLALTSQSTLANVLPQGPQSKYATPPETRLLANTLAPFADIINIVSHGLDCHDKPINSNYLSRYYVQSSTLVPQQRNASKPIKSSAKSASEQPSILMLASLGIKVRDFAYESKLPPIRTIYCHPRQIQPAVVRTTLKPQSSESGRDDYFSQSSSQSEIGRRKLKRTSTEAVLIPPTITDSTDVDETQMKLERFRTSTESFIPSTPESTDIDSDDSTDTDSDSQDSIQI